MWIRTETLSHRMKEVMLLSVHKQTYEKVLSISTSKLASSSLLHRAEWIRVKTLSHGMEEGFLTDSTPVTKGGLELKTLKCHVA